MSSLLRSFHSISVTVYIFRVARELCSVLRLFPLYVHPWSVSYLPVCQCLLTVTPGSGTAVYPVLFGSVSRTDSASRVLEGGFGMRRRSSSGSYPSPCLSSAAPSFPSLSLFSPLISPSSSPTTSGSPQEVQRSKMGWFFPPLFFFFSPSPELTLKKNPNLTAEWLIQIIVAFSCIRLLFFLWLSFCFSSFPWVQCGIWTTCELGPLSEKRAEWHQRGREREGSKNLSRPVIFCSVSMIACMTITDKWVNRRMVTFYVYMYECL